MTNSMKHHLLYISYDESCKRYISTCSYNNIGYNDDAGSIRELVKRNEEFISHMNNKKVRLKRKFIRLNRWLYDFENI